MKTFYYDIEPYQIQASGMQLTVLPMEDGVYRVCHGGEILAVLYPEITAAGIYWNGFGQIPLRFAEEIGQQIYACEI
ncbi:MAG TPA: hypothetical protein VKB19_09490 [Pedobacter sp.]|nr:hypothetical protein [Pedobacter sp.]